MSRPPRRFPALRLSVTGWVVTGLLFPSLFLAAPAAEPGGASPETFSVLLRTLDLNLSIPKAYFLGTAIEARPGWRQPFSGLEGTLVRWGVFSFQTAFADTVAIRVDGSLVETLDVDQDASDPRPGFEISSRPRDTGALRVTTLISAVKRPRYRLGFDFAASLPTTDDKEGIGLDTTDVFAGLIWNGWRESWTLAVNLGVGILTAPTSLREQNDVLTWGLKGSHRLSRSWSFQGEVAGHTQTQGESFLGTEDRSALRAGAVWHGKSLRLELQLIQGLTGVEGGLGAGAGIIWVIRGKA